MNGWMTEMGERGASISKSPFKFLMTIRILKKALASLGKTIHPEQACSQQQWYYWMHYPDWTQSSWYAARISSWPDRVQYCEGIRRQNSFLWLPTQIKKNFSSKVVVKYCYRNTQTFWRRSFLVNWVKDCSSGVVNGGHTLPLTLVCHWSGSSARELLRISLPECDWWCLGFVLFVIARRNIRMTSLNGVIIQTAC